MNRRFVVIGIMISVIIVSGGIYLSYAREMQTIRGRLSAGSQLIQTWYGPIEYATWGNGPAVLVVHGAGGGYDQGSLMVRAFGTKGFRWIVPSRFGYLRTQMPADGSTAAQADAFATLLDALAIERVAILAMSGGVPPFAAVRTAPSETNDSACAALVRSVYAAYSRRPEAAGADLAIPGAL